MCQMSSKTDADNQAKAVRSGISTGCLYPQYPEITLRQLGEAGVKKTEFFSNSFSELEGQYLRELSRIAKGYGTEIVALHPFTSRFESFMLFTSYQRRFEDGLDLYRRYFESCGVLGGQYVVLHGCETRFMVEDNFYLERFALLHEEAKKFGVRLAQENMFAYQSMTLEFLRKMKAQIPDACFVLDVKQARRSGIDPMKMVEVMGDRIVHVHISDNTAEKDCLPPGKGDFPLEKFVEKVRDFHVDPVFILELYRSNFEDLSELLNSYWILAQYCEKKENL